MEINLTVEQETQLAEIAQRRGITADVLLAEVTRGLLEADDREREAIRQRLHQADRGILIEEDEMDARFEKMMRR